MSSIDPQSQKAEEPGVEWFKIPRNILEAAKPVTSTIGQFRDGKKTPQETNKGFLNLPIEILRNVCFFLAWKSQSDGTVTDLDPVSHICLALTCKRLAGVVMMDRLINPISRKKAVRPGSEGKVLMELLAKGWNQDPYLRLCQLSGRFAFDTCYIYNCCCALEPCPLKEIEFPLGVGCLNEDEPLCIHCYRTRRRALELAKPQLEIRILWNGSQFSIEKISYGEDIELWENTLELVRELEEAGGYTVYI